MVGCRVTMTVTMARPSHPIPTPYPSPISSGGGEGWGGGWGGWVCGDEANTSRYRRHSGLGW